MNRRETTRDISSGGVCFRSPNAVEVGTRIEYLITLSGNNPPVRIRCLGKVLRSPKNSVEGVFEVAMTMERYQFLRPGDMQSIAMA